MLSGNNNNNPAVHDSIRGTRLPSKIAYGYWLQIYMIAVIICNLGLLFWDSNSSDTGFWENWVKQLINKGYSEFNGNYPPIYIHWLYIAGKIYSYLNISVENNILLKQLTQAPVLCFHLFLTAIVFNLVKKNNANSLHFHASLLLTVFNPAILFNGPIWGQVDILPVIPTVIALLCGLSLHYRRYTLPLYTLGLMTKFQMVAFAPVFGILFFLDYKVHLKSIFLCAAVVTLSFLPFIATNHFLPAFKLAYVDVLHQYSATTMGASNIWILLTGNAAPDSVLIFGVDHRSFLAPIFIAKNFGIISFACVCLVIFAQGLRNIAKKKYSSHDNQLSEDIFFYAMLCGVAFFTLLPAMHERYLLPAVIVSLIYFCFSPSKAIYPLALSFISAFNLAMTLGLKTSSVWPAISWLMCALFVYGLMELFFKRSWVIFLKDAVENLCRFKSLFIVFFIITWSVVFYHSIETTKIRLPELKQHQALLNNLAPSSVHQKYGALGVNRSVNGTILTTGGKRFGNGLGTHADSRIDYLLPPNAESLSFMVGLDDEVESASVIFSVWGDENLLWESQPFYGSEDELRRIKLNIRNIKRLSLRVSSIQDVNNDHADWIEPILTFNDN